MNLRSNSGGSNGSFFAWLAILGFAAYFMESRTHFFDAPSLKGYSLGMTLKDFKDSQIPNLALQYTEKPNNVLSVSTYNADNSTPFTLAGDKTNIEWFFTEEDRSKVVLYEIAADITPNDNGSGLYAQLSERYGNTEKVPFKDKNGFSAFRWTWKPLFGRYTIVMEENGFFVHLEMFKTSVYKDILTQVSGRQMDI